MAKGSSGQERGNSINSQRKKVTIDTSIDAVIEWDKEGKTLDFSIESFLRLPEEVIDTMSRANAIQYHVARTWAEREEEARKSRPPEGGPRIEVLGAVDPFESKMRDKISAFEGQKEWHYAAIRPDEVPGFKERGYQVVPEDDPVKTHGAVQSGGSRVLKWRDGKDDLVWMRVKEDLYRQHIHAISRKSREKSRQIKEDFADTAKSVDKRLKIFDGNKQIR
jgi:hypothetical protein